MPRQHGQRGSGEQDRIPRPDTFPDFTDCAGTTPEPNGNWKAVIVHGGPSRGLSQIMPAFGDLLSDQQIDDVMAYLRGFCKNVHHDPLGELNLPRALVTEKAFPENELVVSTAASASAPPSWTTDVIDERTIFNARKQLETDIPVNYADRNHNWTEGLGDITLGLKREMFSSLRTGSILSLQSGFLLPIGDSKRGFGAGTTQFEPFAAFDQLFKENTFLQFELGGDFPFDTSVAPRNMFWRATVGQAMAQDHMLGRLYSPMVEFLASRDFKTGASSDWDVLPEMQVTISRRQHARLRHWSERAIHEYHWANAAGSVLPAMGPSGRQVMARMAMKLPWVGAIAFGLLAAFSALVCGETKTENAKGDKVPRGTVFLASDRCQACTTG